MENDSSQESVEWAKGPFDDGALARIYGQPIDAHPSVDTIGPFAVASWRAGWADADVNIAADKAAGTLPFSDGSYNPNELEDPNSHLGNSYLPK